MIVYGWLKTKALHPLNDSLGYDTKSLGSLKKYQPNQTLSSHSRKFNGTKIRRTTLKKTNASQNKNDQTSCVFDRLCKAIDGFFTFSENRNKTGDYLIIDKEQIALIHSQYSEKNHKPFI